MFNPDLRTVAAMCYCSTSTFTDGETGETRTLTEQEATALSFAVACMLYRKTGEGFETDIILDNLMKPQDEISEDEWLHILETHYLNEVLE